MGPTTEEKVCYGLLRKRTCLVPTWRGWLLVGLGALLLLLGAVRGVHPFLAMTDPQTNGFLVVEGWASDHALALTAAELHRNHYEKLYVTGVPLEAGAPLAEYHTYAERGAAVLLKLGLTTNEVEAVPASEVLHDRTYASAMALKSRLRQRHAETLPIHLISQGPHARRSRLMFEKAFENKVRVGVTSVQSTDYDAAHWWRSSAGVRGVLDELVAYAYARFLFRAPPEPAEQ